MKNNKEKKGNTDLTDATDKNRLKKKKEQKKLIKKKKEKKKCGKPYFY